MRYFFTFVFAFFFLCFTYSKSLTISGKIIDQYTGLPVEFASVFIANTTIGTYSDAEGKFQLSYLPEGVLHLIVSHVSYETYIINLTANDNLNILIELKVKVYELQTINITEEDPYKSEKIEAFTTGILGKSRNSLRCKLLNPSVLHFFGKKPLLLSDDWDLKVNADSMIIFKNASLGYTINYELVYFDLSFNKLTFFGYPLFEDKTEKGKDAAILKRRNMAYEGSKLHFFRSLYSQRLEEEGFEVYKIMAYNRDTSVLNYGILGDSLFIGKSNVILKQTKERLNLYDYLTFDTISQSGQLNIIQPFEICYTKRGEEGRYNQYNNYFFGIQRTKNVQTTLVKLRNNNIQFYSNGSFEKPDELITIGYWSYKQLADLLPFDFYPEY